jgi:hypothetical protein
VNSCAGKLKRGAQNKDSSTPFIRTTRFNDDINRENKRKDSLTLHAKENTLMQKKVTLGYQVTGIEPSSQFLFQRNLLFYGEEPFCCIKEVHYRKLTYISSFVSQRADLCGHTNEGIGAFERSDDFELS